MVALSTFNLLSPLSFRTALALLASCGALRPCSLMAVASRFGLGGKRVGSYIAARMIRTASAVVSGFAKVALGVAESTKLSDGEVRRGRALRQPRLL